jgi:alpha-D-ribose 1-methylphosphonate 5-phosphate C-P lyase
VEGEVAIPRVQLPQLPVGSVAEPGNRKAHHSESVSGRQGARRSTIVSAVELTSTSIRTWCRQCAGTRSSQNRLTAAIANLGNRHRLSESAFHDGEDIVEASPTPMVLPGLEPATPSLSGMLGQDKNVPVRVGITP